MDTIPKLRLEIASELKSRKGIGKNGQPYEMFSQEAWLHTPARPYPFLAKMDVPDATDAKPMGTWWLVPYTVFEIGQYDAATIKLSADVLVADSAGKPASKLAAE